MADDRADEGTTSTAGFDRSWLLWGVIGLLVVVLAVTGMWLLVEPTEGPGGGEGGGEGSGTGSISEAVHALSGPVLVVAVAAVMVVAGVRRRSRPDGLGWGLAGVGLVCVLAAVLIAPTDGVGTQMADAARWMGHLLLGGIGLALVVFGLRRTLPELTTDPRA